MKVLIYGVVEVNDINTSPEEIQNAVNETLEAKYGCNFLKKQVTAVEIKDGDVTSIQITGMIAGTKFPIGTIIPLNVAAPEDKKV